MTDPVQRRWTAACPNCGAQVEFASSASASAICSFCRSTLLREGEALRRIGQSAELFADHSPLQLGVRGRHAGAEFTLVGRLQLRYSGGVWNEWHALFDGGKSGWLSEDNGAYVFAFDAALSESPPASHTLVVGAQAPLGGQAWRVASLTLVTLGAAEGELPKPPRLDTGEFLLADLRNSQDEVGTLDYAHEPPQWSVGRAVRLADLQLSGLREDEGATLASRALPCPSCGSSLEPKLSTTKSIVCGQCHAVVDISGGAGADLEHYAQANGMEPQLPLGSTCYLALKPSSKLLPWQVVGYQERCDLPAPGDDEEQTFWREYLLYNRLEGFAFLVDTEEGWSLVRPLTGVPSRTGVGDVEWQGDRFKRRWQYRAKTTYVLGEFYWRVAREDIVEVGDYETPMQLLSSERSGNEITWSLGRKLNADEVAKAFRLAPEKSAALRRDSSALSNGGSLVRTIVIVAVVIILLILLLKACSRDDCQQYKNAYGEASAEYQQCKRSYTSGSGVRPGFTGGSWGGSGSSGGGHK
ncbi:DUF4178 domain-containing protein [Pelomonas sp. SE-A7]|uniref:DUF4178 domain-containing protein n=1 Tax=Pelomonas sp. SE-A7 TaxID=3054953 RepID=UPI00259C7641|nr:DUF4178 domain-containing protein [Pelomonas sp. SE-A7]MDM4765814.1 DUF4178 domain-containing protein [Pelomonas sp. SE-A7]